MEQLALPTGAPIRQTTPTGEGPGAGEHYLIPYALLDDRLVHVDTVESGAACGCICPGCKAPMIARKGAVRRHHFAHASGKGCGESGMHLAAKYLLRDRLVAALAHRVPVNYRWVCGSCGIPHTRDLLYHAEGVEMERPLESCQPDLQILGAGRHPLLFLEVVVTHAPEPVVLETARALRAAVAQMRLTAPEDLEGLKAPHTLTGQLDVPCPLERCACRQGPLYPRELVIFPLQCPTCRRPMKGAMVVDHRASFFAERFLAAEVQYAKHQGVDIVSAIHSTTQTKYLRVQCPHCRTAAFKAPLYEGLQAAYRHPDAVGFGIIRQCLACRMTKAPPAVTIANLAERGSPPPLPRAEETPPERHKKKRSWQIG
jgi:hypothetical protein